MEQVCKYILLLIMKQIFIIIMVVVEQIKYLIFVLNNSSKGSVALTSSAVAFNTSSDYRLKENVDYTWDATTRLKQLKPARFNWISDDTNTLVDGFLAHEVTSVVPNAVTGTKDEVYAVGHDLAGNDLYQSVDPLKNCTTTGQNYTRTRSKNHSFRKLITKRIK